jgi:alkylated DNA nucleotide flippase Atl1
MAGVDGWQGCRRASSAAELRVNQRLPTPFAERVLDLVARIPSGRVMTYADVAHALGEGGPRAVGTVMARYGGGVPWHRVLRAGGLPPIGHEPEALKRYRAERTPMRGTRVDLLKARWAP